MAAPPACASHAAGVVAALVMSTSPAASLGTPPRPRAVVAGWQPLPWAKLAALPQRSALAATRPALQPPLPVSAAGDDASLSSPSGACCCAPSKEGALPRRPCMPYAA